MSQRYRMTPTRGQEMVMLEHCAHARFVWNLAWELSQWGTLETYGEASRRAREDGTSYTHQKRRPVRPRPGLAEQCAMLTEARQDFPWLRAGSSSVQAQALRDFDKAMSAFLDPRNPARCPTPRSKKGAQGFVIRDTKARRISRNVGVVYVPKCGWVRFRWSRELPARLGVARVALVTSDGQHFRAPRISRRDAERYLALQRRFSRQVKGARRREKTRLAMARIAAKVTDRRKDWAEKLSTRLVRDYDLIVFERLDMSRMTRKPKAKPDLGNPGNFLPNQRKQKAGLNRAILMSAWGVLASRTQEKAEASDCAVTYVDPRFTSQQCHACGHIEQGNRDSQAVFICLRCGHQDHADTNAALNILARGLASEVVLAHAPGHGAPRPRRTRRLAAGTARGAA